MTAAETLLWAQWCGNGSDGRKWRRQHPIDRVIVDFYCDECHLIVEVDGGIHLAQPKRDAERTAWLQSKGYHFIRFDNQEIEHDLTIVLSAINTAANQCQPIYHLNTRIY
ncbi:MAG: DUF559 domain-containing protein [Herpetosiphonaceae bacterium]|nr:DUF559 domain-containing protein [Herpetosiphonaceae bacterium]